MDENDNTPMFPLSQYIVQGIAETVAVDTDIIQGEDIPSNLPVLLVGRSGLTVRTLDPGLNSLAGILKLWHFGIEKHILFYCGPRFKPPMLKHDKLEKVQF